VGNDPSNSVVVTVASGAFEKNVRTGGTDPGTEYRHYVLANGKAVAFITRSAANATPTVATYTEAYYLHEDHLGSTDVITKSGGAIHVRTSFDAWGKRRGSAWTGAPSAADKNAINRSTDKGYTGHEQLDNLDLVHMNGRVYDPVIGRFLSADPIIQDPFHSQAFNRYSYVWNNPLNGTDPTGYTVDCEVSTGSRICRPKSEQVKTTNVTENGNPGGSTPTATSAPKQIDAGQRNTAQVTSDKQEKDRGAADATGGSTEKNAGSQGNSCAYIPGTGCVTIPDPTLAGSQSEKKSFLDTLTTPWGGWMKFKNDFKCIFTCQWPGNGPLDSLAALPGGGIVARAEVAAVQAARVGSSLTGRTLRFAGDQAVENFERHAGSVMAALGKNSYNLKNYLDDANHIVRHGTFVPEMNGFVVLVGGTGSAKVGFVGLSRELDRITTFGIRTVKEIAEKAPSLGWSR
jgi:RHS repeat-associated protein